MLPSPVGLDPQLHHLVLGKRPNRKMLICKSVVPNLLKMHLKVWPIDRNVSVHHRSVELLIHDGADIQSHLRALVLLAEQNLFQISKTSKQRVTSNLVHDIQEQGEHHLVLLSALNISVEDQGLERGQVILA